MNIFAQELDKILRKHNKDLGSLFSLRIPDPRTGSERPIPPSKVVRLKRSLDRDITATLNAEELEALQAWAPLDAEGQELRRLRAALVAEGVRHLLAGRIAAEQAHQLGKLTLQSIVDGQAQSTDEWREALQEHVRGFSYDDVADDEFFGEGMTVRGAATLDSAANAAPDAAAEETPVAAALEPTAEIYEMGALWLAIALNTPERQTQAGYVALALSLFERARVMVEQVPSFAQNTSEQRQWLATIEATIAAARARL